MANVTVIVMKAAKGSPVFVVAEDAGSPLVMLLFFMTMSYPQRF
jgi:hypothetical protein